ncbi:MAG: N-acetylmuramoyl-L-alanine amidase family protein [Desulfitobacteriaceae bacterium]
MRRLLILPGRMFHNLAVLVVLGVMASLVLSVLWQGSAVLSGQLNDLHVVVIDPGHGGYDPGAITKQGLYEKEINLVIAEKVAGLLRPTGIQVLLTRDKDEDYVSPGITGKESRKRTDLNYRIGLASKANADIFVSLHVNATVGGSKSGAETFYHFKSASGKELAEAIQSELQKIPGMNRRIAKPGDFYVINNTSMPAVLVELGYLTNPGELAKIKQPWYQEQLAHAVAKGIAKYLGLP